MYITLCRIILRMAAVYKLYKNVIRSEVELHRKLTMGQSFPVCCGCVNMWVVCYPVTLYCIYYRIY